MMYLCLLILLIAGGFLVYIFSKLILRDIQAQRRYEAHRRYIMAYGTEEEKQALALDELEDMMLGLGGLVMLDMLDGELDGEIDWW